MDSTSITQAKKKAKELMEKPWSKVFNDPVHGTISVHPLAVAIMDTPGFQRLRHIYQLGGVHYVYPSAAHSRFEHSIGVYHLAGQLVNMLKEQQPELGIDDSDVLCVQLAGLTHDLGHGPFSHLFDGQVVPRLQEKCKEKWKHEQGSVDMLDHIYTKPEVKKCFEEYRLNEEDFKFIKSLILCKPDEGVTGRGLDKKFLYDIVANGRNGIDVDKWDYLARDSYHLGIKCGFEHTRLLHNMRVVKVDGMLQMCVRDKEADAIRSMFQARYELTEKAYEHKVVHAVQMMIAEALYKAADHLKFSGKTMMECVHDMEAYTHLHDGVFFKILQNTDDNLGESRQLLEKLQNRKLWKFVGQAEIPRTNENGPKKMDEGEKKKEDTKENDVQKTKDVIKQTLDQWPIELSLCSRILGQDGKNPFNALRFYSKRDPNTGFKLSQQQRQITWPNAFKQTWLRAYYTGTDDEIPDEVRKEVEMAFKGQGLELYDKRDEIAQ